MIRLPDHGPARAALAVGAIGLVVCLAGAVLNLRVLLAAWMTAAILAVGFPLGAMTLLMIHGLTGGRWGDAMRPCLRAMTCTLPLALVLLLPVAARPDLVFPWAVGDTATLPDVIREKLSYLNVPFFLVRLGACAAIWLVLAALILNWTDGDKRTRSSRGFALGLVLQGAAVSVFAIDWMLSLDPELSSTVYGMLEASAEVVGAASLTLLVLAATQAVAALPGGGEKTSLGEDVANMLFGFMLTLAYLAYMQWLVIWAGDLPNEIHWYVLRTSGIWLVVLWLVILLQFILPFGGFLVRDVKRIHRGLMSLAAAMLAGHIFETLWRVRAPLVAPKLSSIWIELGAFAGAGGLWLAVFLLLLREPQLQLFWRRVGIHD
ncbi:hypothetical protein [Mesorhizobium sp. J8]|uniref:hypothetical protein n=1 Tax=Mesorhizobium sp. J8 TaxID=2777475 RepID=UPI001915C770|nr:hypothetical protein [Mesorhizobium sp. J8]BCM20984.1 hypothetical protein MJ8_47750 [Mesorhizobium sp. J8]